MGDSAVIALMACQSVLSDCHFDPYPQPELARTAAVFLNKLPQQARVKIADYISRTIGHPREDFLKIDPESSARWVTDGYDKPKYPGVILGAPGLSLTFLSGLTGYPYLPQPMLFNARRDIALDDSRGYVEAGMELCKPFLEKHWDMEATIHYDPVHDRFLIRRLVFVRLKYLSMPQAYVDFLLNRLEPGSPVILLDCRYQWPRAEVSERCFYQLGGLGDVPAMDYLEEPPYLKTYREEWGGKSDSGWMVDYPFAEGPESEWGSTGNFLDEAFIAASELGHLPVRVVHSHPGELSGKVFRLYLNCATEQYRIQDVYIASFTHTEPKFPLTSGKLPLWVPFITRDSLNLACDVLEEWWKITGRTTPDGTAWVSLHPSFCSPPDIIGLDEWESRLSKYFRDVKFPGIDPEKYPADLGSYVMMHPALVKITEDEKYPGTAFKKPSVEELAKYLT